jgi:hypothetical protein
MKIILMQEVRLEDYQNGSCMITKIFESPVIPHKGDYITDSLWKKPYEQEVVEVNINYQNNECYVSFKPITLKTNSIDRLRNYIEMAKLHEWESAIKV